MGRTRRRFASLLYSASACCSFRAWSLVLRFEFTVKIRPVVPFNSDFLVKAAYNAVVCCKRDHKLDSTSSTSRQVAGARQGLQARPRFCLRNRSCWLFILISHESIHTPLAFKPDLSTNGLSAGQVFLSLTLHERNLLSLDFMEHISKAAATLFLEHKAKKKTKRPSLDVTQGHHEKVSARKSVRSTAPRDSGVSTCPHVVHVCCMTRCGVYVHQALMFCLHGPATPTGALNAGRNE